MLYRRRPIGVRGRKDDLPAFRRKLRSQLAGCRGLTASINTREEYNRWLAAKLNRFSVKRVFLEDLLELPGKKQKRGNLSSLRRFPVFTEIGNKLLG